MPLVFFIEIAACFHHFPSLSHLFFSRLADEINLRKKLENSLADAQRVIAEKETQVQDLNITISQNRNAHLDTQKDRDSLHSALNQTQQAYDTETVARSDLQNLANQLREKLDFERTIHDRVCRFAIFVYSFFLLYLRYLRRVFTL